MNAGQQQSFIAKQLAKTTDPKEVNRLKRQHAKVWHDELAKIATVGIISYKKHVKYLNDYGIEHSLVDGMNENIFINAERKLFYKMKMNDYVPIHGTVSSHVLKEVVMNPNVSKDAPWLFYGVRHDGSRGNYFYTEKFVREQRKKKFSNVKDLIEKIDSIRAKWLTIIENGSFRDQRTGAAVILELLWRFSARIGSPGNGVEGGKKTYGISTLLVKHCKMKWPNFALSYLGKKAVKTKHTFDFYMSERGVPTNLDVFKIMEHMMSDKRPSDELFTYWTKSGKAKPIRANVVNDLFRELGAGDCTVHKLRTYHATKMAMDLIEEFKTKRKMFRNDKDCHKALVAIAEKVGKRLNHIRKTKEGKNKVTGTTALQNYIDPSLQVEFFDHYGIEHPKYLQKLLGTTIAA